MQLTQRNIFTKGIVSDIDPMHISPDSWVFPTINYRVMNKEGQGFILSTLASNTDTSDRGKEFEGGEFKIKDDFIAIGTCEYNGILYIVSHNVNTNESEIGTFPSYNEKTKTWIRRYKPLTNYSSNTQQELWYAEGNESYYINNIFKTSRFDYSIDRMVEIIAKESYDTSVDLYICDGYNPNRVINNGFKSDGTSNNRMYIADDFYGKLNQIASTASLLKAELNSIGTNGKLKYGNYYLYFRLLTEDYARTSFVENCGVIQIYDGNTNLNKDIQGGNSIDESNKSITVNLYNIDTTYKYIEVAIVKYMSDDSDIVFKDIKLIDNYYRITGEEMFITIYGTETLTPLLEAEIIMPNGIERTCKTHLQVDNRYIGANWSSPDKNSKLLATLASHINVDLFTQPIHVGTPNVLSGVIHENVNYSFLQYKNYYLTYDKVGYFRGEIYCFTAGFEYTDGSRSNAFPINGYDFVTKQYTLDNGEVTGIVRMPFHEQQDDKDKYILLDGIGNKIRILGVRFIVDEMINAINSLSKEDKEWFVKNVKGIFIARAKRNPLIAYQGLSVIGSQFKVDYSKYHSKYGDWESLLLRYNYINNDDIWNKYNVRAWEAYEMYKNPNKDNLYGYITNNTFNIKGDSNYRGVNSIMPLFMNLAPMMSVHCKKESKFTEAKNYAYYAALCLPKVTHYGIYSPDFIFQRSNEDISKFDTINTIKVIGRTVWREKNKYGFYPNLWKEYKEYEPSHFPRWYIMDFYGYPTKAYYENDNYISKEHSGYKNLFTVGDIQVRTNGDTRHGMINNATDLATNSDKIFGAVVSDNGEKYNCNRSIFCRKYIGLEFNDNKDALPYDIFNSKHNLDLCYVNVYRHNPTRTIQEVVSWYSNRDSLFYYPIGKTEKFNYNLSKNKVTLQSLDGNIIHHIDRFYGDCFLQKTFIKIHTWGHEPSKFKGNENNEIGLYYSDAQPQSEGRPLYTNTKKDLEVEEKYYYRHGLIVGVITENNINTAMRYAPNELEYYPHVGYPAWAIMPLNEEGIETFACNRAHSEVLSVDAIPFYDANAPHEVNKRPTRIRFSSRHTPYSFVDAYRLFDVNAYRDYELSDGPIMSIKEFNKKLFSIQTSAINKHEYGREEVKAPTNIGDIVLGKSDYLSPYVEKLSNYGTQHRFSVVISKDAIYGVDYNKCLIWNVKSIETKTGVRYIGATPISKQNNIESFLKNVIDEYTSGRSDIKSYYEDNPIRFRGCVAGVDNNYDEIVFTFFNDKDNSYKTLAYSELINGFLGEFSYGSHLYANINNDFFSFRTDAFRNCAYLHNRKDSDLLIYNQKHKSTISFIVNGIVGENNLTDFEKSYDSITIGTNHIPFDNILFETENGSGLKEPFDSKGVEFWSDPEWLENKYYMPVQAQNEEKGNEFLYDTQMRGTWMKVTLEYNDRRRKFLKSILTDFTTSQV